MLFVFNVIGVLSLFFALKRSARIARIKNLGADLDRIIAQFRYIKIQLETKDPSTRLRGINTEFVGFIPQSLMLLSIVLG